MSSRSYSACLDPDPTLRRVVARTGHACGAIGTGLLLQLPLAVAPRLALAALFLAHLGWQLWRLHRGWSRCRGLRVYPDGRAALRTAGGDWQPARLLAGSVALPWAAWLTFELGDGTLVAEALRPRSRRAEWRRLLVICRHVGAPV